jgi:WD40 repeat protein/serine/threonine protein kinase/tetratricopeptide (TPR) repeat protein
MSVSASSQYALLNRLAEEFADRYRRGERPALSEYTDQYPDLAEEIRELFPAMVEIERVEDARREPAGPRVPAQAASSRQLGDYLILREVGRGGMGVVYEAVQHSLGRHVALKVLPHEALAGSNQVERFRLEARAAARLHHTNIVPVFGVGESEGLHYYAMQFIQGQGLDVVIDALRGLRHDSAPGVERGAEPPGRAGSDEEPLTAVLAQSLLTGRFAAPQPEPEPQSDPQPESTAAPTTAEALTSPPSQDRAVPAPPDRPSALPTTDAGHSSELSSAEAGAPYYRSVARVGVQVAEALAHAHGQGILHRDIKPSNLLLDAKGTVWVTDFGLAKAEGSDGLTRTGDIVGTLRYMAPERFDGWSDPRSDVYSLGATLYELLTLRPPFREPDRLKLIEQVMHEEPAPPQKLDRRIPRDLETIVLKALAKEPGHRYTTADQMAEDLRRFAADRPILARRISTAERTWRWCKRNPKLAAATGAVAAALVAVAVISVIYARAQARATHQIKGLLGESNRLLAIRNFERGQVAFEKGEIGPGMLWMIESWRSAVAADDPAWQHAARANLVAWRPHHRRLKAVLSQTSPIEHAAFSPDSRIVISSSREGTAQLWDAASGKKFGPPMHAGGQLLHMSFSPDGKTVLTVSEGDTARLWDAVTGLPHGLPLRLLPQTHILAAGIQPDGKIMLTGAEDNADDIARLWDPVTGHPIGVPLRHPGGIRGVVLSPDGKTVLTGGRDGTLRLWDAASGQPIGLPVKHPGGDMSRVALGPDSKTIVTFSGAHASRYGSTMRLWDAVTGRSLGLAMRQDGQIMAVAFSPDAKTLLTGGRDGTARLWDTASGKPLDPPMRGESGLRSAAFSPDGKTVLAAYQNKECRLWDAATGQLIGVLEHQGSVMGVAFSPDGTTLLTLGLDGTVRLWDSEPGKPVGQILEIPTTDRIFDWSPDRKVAVTFPQEPNYQRYLRLWDTNTGKPIGPRLPQPGGNEFCYLSTGGKVLLTIEANQRAVLWDATTGVARGPAFLLPCKADAAGPNPDGETFWFTGTDKAVWICNGVTGTVRGRTPVLRGTAYFVGFSPDGKAFFTGLHNGEVQLWDAATFAPLAEPFGNPGVVICAVFSPDRKSVLVGHEDGSVWLWDLASRKSLIPPLRNLRSGDGSFSPDGKTIVTNAPRLWDAATGQPIGAILASDLGKRSSFIAGGTTLFVGGKVARLFPVPPDLPDDLQRVATWVEVITGLTLDRQQGLIQVLDNAAWLERRERLTKLGGPPETGPEQRLDPILYGPDPTARARSLMQRKQWDAAEAAFDEAMRARPFNMQIVQERSDLYVRRGLWSEAAAYYATKVKQYPEVAPLHEQLAVTRFLAGDVAGYRAACGEMLERFKPIDDSTAAIRVAYACSLAVEAVSDLPGLIEVSERSTRWESSNERAVGAVLFRAGRLEEALKRFVRAAQALPHRARDFLFLAMIHGGLGHPSEARRLLQQAEEWITEADKAPSGTEEEGPRWNNLTDRPTTLLLRREAEAVIRSDGVFPTDPFAPGRSGPRRVGETHRNEMRKDEIQQKPKRERIGLVGFIHPP